MRKLLLNTCYGLTGTEQLLSRNPELLGFWREPQPFVPACVPMLYQWNHSLKPLKATKIALGE